MAAVVVKGLTFLDVVFDKFLYADYTCVESEPCGDRETARLFRRRGSADNDPAMTVIRDEYQKLGSMR